MPPLIVLWDLREALPSALYKKDNAAAPQAYLPASSKFSNSGRYMTGTLLPVVVEKMVLPTR
ncbi:hypothetical protein H5410_029382 [Solanum commersonii]|uniref:Uncharacterized protein n=1 Tax=Solanum commersonii TaxID=4109 RepID=A0A9J5Z5H0_SOLCO|nr:hypothetical protein H5410_029382 [Solanum commersonii]